MMQIKKNNDSSVDNNNHVNDIPASPTLCSIVTLFQTLRPLIQFKFTWHPLLTTLRLLMSRRRQSPCRLRASQTCRAAAAAIAKKQQQQQERQPSALTLRSLAVLSQRALSLQLRRLAGSPGRLIPDSFRRWVHSKVMPFRQANRGEGVAFARLRHSAACCWSDGGGPRALRARCESRDGIVLTWRWGREQVAPLQTNSAGKYRTTPH